MANEIELAKSVMSSDLPRQHKTAMQRIFDKVTGGKISGQIENKEIVIAGDHQRALGKVVRDGLEGGAIGAAYGYIDSKIGLDSIVGPLDAYAGIASGAASVALGSNALSEEARNLASSSFTVFGYRKMKSIYDKKKAAAATIAHGEGDDSDPIMRVAASVGKKSKK